MWRYITISVLGILLIVTGVRVMILTNNNTHLVVAYNKLATTYNTYAGEQAQKRQTCVAAANKLYVPAIVAYSVDPYANAQPYVDAQKTAISSCEAQFPQP